jgi:hypothetical protein
VRALVVTSAYLLTPHLNTDLRPWMEAEIHSRLFHPEYRKAFRFGAVTLRPGMGLAEIEMALSQILADVGIDARAKSARKKNKGSSMARKGLSLEHRANSEMTLVARRMWRL